MIVFLNLALVFLTFPVKFSTVCGSINVNNIEFPPQFQPSADPNIRAGHLNPFGYQRPPNGPIVEYDKPLRPEIFWEAHVSQNVPLVFRGGISKSPALSKWTDRYIKEKYGDLDVLIEKRKENRTHGMTSRLLLGDFIDRYKDEDIYVVTVMPDPMREEVQVVSSLLCGTFLDYLHETNFWMGSGGTRSVIHYDADHNIHCMVAGRKDFIMINQKYRTELKLTKFPQFGSGFSMVDPDVINLDNYPDIPNVEWTYTTIKAGDCIFIPSGYIHQVRSYARTISATMLFTASVNNTFEPIGCENATFEYTPMSKVDVQWTYKKGDKIIEMGFMNIEKFRKLLIDRISELDLEKITPEIFKELVEDSFPMEEEEDAQRDPIKLFHTHLDIEGKGYVTVEDIKKLSKKDIKKIALYSEAPHGPMKIEYPPKGTKHQEDDHENEQENSNEKVDVDKKREREEL